MDRSQKLINRSYQKQQNRLLFVNVLYYVVIDIIMVRAIQHYYILKTSIKFLVFLSRTKNLKTIIWHQVFLYNRNIVSSLSSSLSCHAASADLPDILPLPFSIVYRPRLVHKSTSRIGTELLYISSSWSSCSCSSVWRGPQEYIAYESVPTSPAVSCWSGSSNLDSLRDRW